MPDLAFQQCVFPDCAARYDLLEVRTACDACGGLLDVAYDWERLPVPRRLADFEQKWGRRSEPACLSGVWRFHELLPFAPPETIVSVGEGQTLLRPAPKVAAYIDAHHQRTWLQFEGLNPSGSFKDNGMTAAFTHAALVGATSAACASTGNTSASLAMYAAASGANMRAIVFIGEGKIAYGKLSQALDYGALTLQIEGDFDDAMACVREVSAQAGVYLVNSVNPFRLEGQKTIMYRVLEGLRWRVPDWIVVPGGNLGNSSAFGKAFSELHCLGLIDRLPRLAVVNAAGADTLHRLVNERGVRFNSGRPPLEVIDAFYAEMDAENRRANTLASAIEINRPVNLIKCLRALEMCDGVVTRVTDQEILDAKAQVGAGGFGCEPASAASVAGARKLRKEGVIGGAEEVVCILTGHALKDPNVTVGYHMYQGEDFRKMFAARSVSSAPLANRPIGVKNDTEQIRKTIAETVKGQPRSGDSI